MRTSRWSRPASALVLAVCALQATSGLALATSKSTSVVVFGGPSFWKGNTTFVANWSVRGVASGSAMTIYLDSLRMSGTVTDGRICLLTTMCTAFSFTPKAVIKYRGTTVKTLSFTSSSCGAGAAGPNDIVLQRCIAATSFKLDPFTYVANLTVTFTWSVGVYAGNLFFYGDAWSASKTVNLWP